MFLTLKSKDGGRLVNIGKNMMDEKERKNMKRISKSVLAFVLTVALAISPLSAFAEATGQTGENSDQDSGYMETYTDLSLIHI